MAINERYQLIDRQTYLGQVCLNVYFYRQTAGGTPTAALLADAFIADVIPLMLPLQNTEVTHTSVSVINVDDPDDYAERILSTGNEGTAESDGLPPYVAWAFKYTRATRAVRNGQKRIVGVSEANQSLGVAVGGALVDLAALAVVLEQDLDDGGATLFEPRIFHRAPPVVVGGETVYPPLSEGTDYGIIDVGYTRISTQNTRKFGRGI